MGMAGMAIGGGGGSSTGGASAGAAGGLAGAAGSSGGTAGSATGGTAGNGTGGAAPSGGYPLRNPPVASAGCSKPLSTFKIGTSTYKITSAGLNREYIVNIPENYDPNVPHRLVFGMHWYKGSADDVQGWSKWFGLKALDKDATIFVAPNGTGNPPLWTQGEKDHAFFDDLVKLFESDLCVDKSRIFSVGFSFGAMFSNSLAQTHQDVLRGVVVYAAADVNIYFPANTGKPLAYMGVHGLKDPTCSIASGRSSRDRFVKNNACTVPATVPEAKSGNHVTYDYKCPSSYPVQWTTFDGGHTYPPNDTGTWVYALTWDFITQF
jgi:poly(3-hydroxybutyrate) depolymerase